MTFLNRLLESRSEGRPTTKITMTELANLLSGPVSATGRVVNPSTAMQISTVFACISLLAETFASLPGIVYRRVGRGKERATEHPLYTVLHDIANPEQTSIDYRSMAQAHILMWGKSYSEISRNGAGAIKALWPITPTRVREIRNARNELVYQVTTPDGGTRNLAANRVLKVSGLLELSPIAQARESLGLTLAAEEYGARFFSNDTRPGGVLEHPGNLSEEAQERLRKSVETVHAGLSNKHRLMILEEGMKWQQIGLAPEDSQFLETRRFQVADIARWFGVPPHMVGDVERSTSWGTGIEQQNIGFIVYSLRKWLVRWEQALNKTALTETERKIFFVEFLVDGLLRGDYKTRQEGLAIQRQNGIINADEWRELENMNEIPDGSGKVYLVNSAMKPVDQLGEESEPVEEPTAPEDEEEVEE